MKKILVLIVILGIGYFVFGYVLVLLNWFSSDTYLTYSAIIGSVASVSGLLAFNTNKLEREDIERVGIENLKKFVESAENLKLKEEELASKEIALSIKDKEIKR